MRFELCYLGMDPDIECVTLWRDRDYLDKFEGRRDLLDYAEQQGIEVTQTKHSYSEDENILHISYESGELEDPAFPGCSREYPGLVLKRRLAISGHAGRPGKCDDRLCRGKSRARGEP